MRTPGFPRGFDYDRILTNAAVSERTWGNLAGVTNYVLARGEQCVPACSPLVEVTLPSATDHVYTFRVHRRYQCLQRVWTVSAKTTADSDTILLKAPSTDPGITGYINAEQVRSVSAVENIATQADTTENVSIAVRSTDKNFEVVSISCYELVRPTLEIADSATSPTRFRAGQPIRDGGAWANVNQDDSLIATRTLLQSATPNSTTYAKSITSSTGAAITEVALPALGRKIGRSDTTRTATFAVNGWHTGTSADFRVVTANNGSSAWTAVTQTTPGTTFVTVDQDIDCEDLAQATGMQSATFDTVTLEGRAGGGGTLYVSGISGLGA